MKRSEFLVKMQDAIRPDEAISEYTNLADIKQWDSLARTLVLVLFQKTFGFRPDYVAIRDAKTIKDLLDMAKDKYEG